MARETFYDVLGVDADADEATIRRAYRRRAKEWHPDVSDHPDARERFKRANRARAVLTDRSERARYDRMGHEAYLERDRRGTGGRAGDDSNSTPDRDSGAESSADETATGRKGAAAGREGRTAGRTERKTERGGRASGRGGTANGRSGTTGDRSATEGGGERASGRRSGSAPSPRLGRFAATELLAAVLLPAVAAATLALAVVAGRTVAPSLGEPAALLGAWLVAGVVAGRLAAGGSAALPREVVRAHAFPLVLLVGAWYVRLGTGRALLAAGLVVYAGHAALLRASALAAGRDGSTARAAVVWLLGTAPVVLALSARRAAAANATRLFEPLSSLPLPGLPSLSLPLVGDGSVLVLGVASAAAVALGHALCRLRAVVR